MKYILFFLLIFSQTVFAQNAKQMAFIGGSERPNIQILLQDKDLLAPFSLYPAPAAEAYRDVSTAVRNAVNVITDLERAFPGATYAFLGRDTDFIAEAVSAFYTALGQPERVARIQLSSSSFPITQANAIAYLQTLGLSQPADSTPRKFIIIDYTSFSQNSQSTQLTNHILNYFRQSGVPLSQLSARVNVGTFGANGIAVGALTDAQLQTELSHQATQLSATGLFNKIVKLRGARDVTYSLEWHGPYGLMTNDNGTWTPARGAVGTAQTRTVIFHNMISVINALLDPIQMAQTMATLANHGIVLQPPIPVVQKTPEEIKEETLATLRDAWKNLAKTEGQEYDTVKIRDEKIKLTPNGARMYDALTTPQMLGLPDYMALALGTLVDLYESDFIGSRDFRRMFMGILTKQPITEKKSPYLNGQNFRQFVWSKDFLEPIEILLDRDREREKYSSVGGLAQQNYLSLVENGARPLSRGCFNLFATP